MGRCWCLFDAWKFCLAGLSGLVWGWLVGLALVRWPRCWLVWIMLPRLPPYKKPKICMFRPFWMDMVFSGLGKGQKSEFVNSFYFFGGILGVIYSLYGAYMEPIWSLEVLGGWRGWLAMWLAGWPGVGWLARRLAGWEYITPPSPPHQY